MPDYIQVIFRLQLTQQDDVGNQDGSAHVSDTPAKTAGSWLRWEHLTRVWLEMRGQALPV